MMTSRRSQLCRGVVLFAAAAGSLRILSLTFAGPAAVSQHRTHMGRAAFKTGQVNLGLEMQDMEVPHPPQPILACDEGCMTAIFDCLDEGCSVDALVKLDTRLAEDEQKIVDSVEQLKAAQKMGYSAENAGTLAWLGNFLSRSGSLRGQLRALHGLKDSDFVRQMMKAAAVAFGGGRPTDYPKVGVSSYTA
ncbi:unnamed protein product [Polarella glacialis]|uniref:Uncharacterized protein n=1 Tax=Polarella glacialis TaxID=89957 RepID=A0A813GER8_POLGL|nr:unnamed protein product [Polarella glacialis]|mmetsp:Transcript_99004/g.178769  ORF Transcript_99004/g.178769 Transcript_99004/m.178769 type:complete len:191 (-) Transcript_99004:72-644(-)